MMKLLGYYLAQEEEKEVFCPIIRLFRLNNRSFIVSNTMTASGHYLPAKETPDPVFNIPMSHKTQASDAWEEIRSNYHTLADKVSEFNQSSTHD